jgi:hypothetical protein
MRVACRFLHVTAWHVRSKPARALRPALLIKGNRVAPASVQRATCHPQHSVEPGARAMPPLTGWVSAARRERPGSALMNAPAGRSLSLCESTHSCQGSGLAASLAPRTWHERAFEYPDRASSSQGCLMSLRLVRSSWAGARFAPQL